MVQREAGKFNRPRNALKSLPDVAIEEAQKQIWKFWKFSGLLEKHTTTILLQKFAS